MNISREIIKSATSASIALIVFFAACCAAYAFSTVTAVCLTAVVTAWVAPIVAIFSLGRAVNLFFAAKKINA